MKDWRTLAFTILAGLSTAALLAGAAVLWDMSGTLREIGANISWIQKTGDARDRRLDDHELRIRAVEKGK